MAQSSLNPFPKLRESASMVIMQLPIFFFSFIVLVLYLLKRQYNKVVIG